MTVRPRLDHLVPVPVRRGELPAASDVAGTGIDGARREVRVAGSGRWTLLLFLASACDGCRPLWEGWAQADGGRHFGLPDGGLALAVTHGPGVERPDRLARVCAAAAGGAPGPGIAASLAERLVLSDPAWRQYRVLGPPFFALAGPDGAVATEGVAWAVEQVAGEVRRAVRHPVPARPPEA